MGKRRPSGRTALGAIHPIPESRLSNCRPAGPVHPSKAAVRKRRRIRSRPLLPFAGLSLVAVYVSHQPPWGLLLIVAGELS